MTARTRVFIVDDHPLVREWLTVLLQQQPDLVFGGQAEDAVTGLAAMIADPPDVAIVDLTLKNASGLDLIKDLGEHLPGTQVVVLSMHDEIFYAERALRAGARAYVVKHESTDRIIDAIRTVRTGRIFASPHLLARLTERMIGSGSPTPPGDVSKLSDRELEVFRRLGDAQGTRRISEELKVSIKTIQAYCARIKEKLRRDSGAELVREAVRWVEQQRHV